MRTKILLLVVAIALTTGIVGPAAAATVHTSQIIGFGYSPDPLTVSVGDSVQWENVAPNADHTATLFPTASSTFSFDTGVINSGAASAPVLMTTPGTFTLQCVIHGTAMRQQLVDDATPPPDVPDVPVPALLGLSALAVLGGVIALKLRGSLQS